MTNPEPPPEESEPKERVAHPFRTLSELVDYVSGKSLPTNTAEEVGLAEALPFPFLAIVGQKEMKLALLLGLALPFRLLLVLSKSRPAVRESESQYTQQRCA